MGLNVAAAKEESIPLDNLDGGDLVVARCSGFDTVCMVIHLLGRTYFVTVSSGIVYDGDSVSNIRRIRHTNTIEWEYV